MAERAPTVDESMDWREERVVHLAGLVDALSDHVYKKNLSGFQEPSWFPDRSAFSRKVNRLLYTLTVGEGLDGWVALLLFLAILLTPFAVLFLPLSIPALKLICYTNTLSSLIQSPDLRQELVEALGISIGAVVVLLHSVPGAYWQFYQVLTNKGTSRWVKIIIAIAALGSIAGFSWKIWVTPLSAIDSGYAVLDKHFSATMRSWWYPIVAWGLSLIPVSLALAVRGIRAIIALFLFAVSIWKWLFRFQKLESMDALRTFLTTPVSSEDSKTEVRLLRLSESEIQVVHRWATGRQTIVQNRLLPNTKLVSIPIDAVLSQLRTWQDWTFLTWLITYVLVILSIVVIGLLIRSLVVLLNEAFVADFLVEACILAQAAYKQKPARPTGDREAEASTEESADPSILPCRCLEWLLRLFIRRAGRSRK